MVDSFISTSDMGKAILEFVESEQCQRIINTIEDNKVSAFKAGAAIAVSVMLSACPKYVGRRYSEEEPDSAESLQNLEEQLQEEKSKSE